MLYQSDMVLYDHASRGIWSQVDLQAETGRFAGRSLAHLPFKVVSFANFKRRHPQGMVLSTDTGFPRPYHQPADVEYYQSDRLVMRVNYGDALPTKTLGMGVRVGDQAWFVTHRRARNHEVHLQTPAGVVRIGASAAGKELLTAPKGVAAVQTLYFGLVGMLPRNPHHRPVRGPRRFRK